MEVKEIRVSLSLDSFDDFVFAKELLSTIENKIKPSTKVTHMTEAVPEPPPEPETAPPPPEPEPEPETAPPPPTTEVDAKGMPFDPRIHSRTKTIKKNGLWRYKRGVDKGYIAQVEKELVGTAVGMPETETEPETAPPPPPAEEMTFKDFMAFIKTMGYDTVDKMNVLAQKLGLPSIATLATKPALIADAVKHVTENA